MMDRIYFDGESRPSANGRKRICIVAIRNGVADVIEQSAGRGSSYDAEWDALIFAAAYAVREGYQTVEFVGDHEGVIDAAAGRLRMKGDALKAFRQRFDEASGGLASFSTEHVLRYLNLAGRCLEEGRNSASFRTGLFMLEGVAL